MKAVEWHGSLPKWINDGRNQYKLMLEVEDESDAERLSKIALSNGYKVRVLISDNGEYGVYTRK